MQICQTRERLGPEDALGPSPLVDIVASVCVSLHACPWTRANLSSSHYVFMLMKVSQTEISVAPHEYGNSEMRTATRGSLENSSLSEHLYMAIMQFEDLASNNNQTWKTWCSKAVIYRSDKTKQGFLQTICSNNKTLRLLSFFFHSANFSRPLKHIRKFDAQRRMFFFCEKHWNLHTVLDGVIASLCKKNASAVLQRGANGSDSSRHSLLVSFPI